MASANRVKKDRVISKIEGEGLFMSSAGERAVNGKGELTEGLAAPILEHIRGGGAAAGTHLTAQGLAKRFSEEHLPLLDLLAREKNQEASRALRRHLEHTIGNLQEIRPILEH